MTGIVTIYNLQFKLILSYNPPMEPETKTTENTEDDKFRAADYEEPPKTDWETD